MIYRGDFEEERWPVAVVAIALAVAGYALFAAAWRAGWWAAAPILLWGGTIGLLAAAVGCFGGKQYYTAAGWRRYTSARHFALLSSVFVGAWLGSHHAPWASLMPVPAFAALVNLVSHHDGIQSECYRPEPAARWNAYVVSGELLGWLVAVGARALLR